MIKKLLFVGAIAGVAMSLTGCNTTDINAAMGNGNGVSTSNVKHKPTSADKVKVYYSKSEMPKRHQVIGRVSANNYNFVGMTISQETIIAELKKQAAALGATGIYHIKSGMMQTDAEAII
ncbi:TPA: hypothetical protein ACTUNV_002656 [Legionella pneumophila]